uniref:G-protein coupled receptors family 1 profile domain-containing protein n=1 Tax=Lates calcarifer TaxID=8187 RepID=A0A4W6EMD1_LATCA
FNPEPQLLSIYSIFFIVGFPANCLSLYVAWMLMRSGNNMAVYLVNLSISDLLYTITLPVWIELALQTPIGGDLCSLVAVIMYNSFYVGSGLLCCISVDRYLALVYPLHFHWVREVRTAAVTSIVVWALEIVIHIILLDHTGALQAFSSSFLCQDKVPMKQEDANIALARISLGFLVPVFIMTFCFQQIMQSLQQSTSILAEERRKLLTVVLLCLLFCFGPIHVMMLVRTLISIAISSLNCLADPLLYCFITRTGQANVNQVVLFCQGKKRSQDEGMV